jgi:hypothetical protein
MTHRRATMRNFLRADFSTPHALSQREQCSSSAAVPVTSRSEEKVDFIFVTRVQNEFREIYEIRHLVTLCFLARK